MSTDDTSLNAGGPDEQAPPLILDETPDAAPAPPGEVPPPAAAEPVVVVAETNAVQDFSINMPEMRDSGEQLALPSDLDSKAVRAIDHTPNIKLTDSPDARRWSAVLGEGMDYNTMNEVLVPAMSEPGSEFRQNNQVGGRPLIGSVPQFQDVQGQNIKGERALLRLVSHLGHGTVFQAPLWHSGIWVTFKPPTEAEIVELNRSMMADKIKFGRSSYGLMYSNMTAFTIDRLVDFALDHVYNLTSKTEDVNKENLRDHVVCQDIPSLLWGFVCTMYPRGFLYERACISNPEKCNFVLKETLNVMKLQWTNMKSLTEWQKTHMSSRQPKIKTLADIKRYKEELARLQHKRITVNEGLSSEVSFTLRSPSITEYISSGHQWINGIVENVDRALGIDASTNERNNTITLQGQASALRQYAHWIESIEFQGNITDDRESVDEMLALLTADDEIRDRFLTEVVNYISTSTMSVIGIPVFKCPQCGTDHTGNDKFPHHTNIIPLDVAQVFFGLITQRLERIATR